MADLFGRFLHSVDVPQQELTTIFCSDFTSESCATSVPSSSWKERGTEGRKLDEDLGVGVNHDSTE